MTNRLTDAIHTFRTGDLVFTRHPPKGPQPIHVTLFLDSRDGGPAYVHAGKTELEIAGADTYAVDKDSGGYLHVFPADPERRRHTAAVAQIFARTAPRTPYGHFPDSGTLRELGADPREARANRFGGMIKTASIAEIPFEFPALHRLLKWTRRAIDNAPLSENRGITCAAFVSCCQQVGMMKAFLQDPGTSPKTVPLDDCLSILNTLVVTKEALRRDLELEVLVPADRSPTGKPIHKGQAVRANSNRTLTVTGRKRLLADYAEARAALKDHGHELWSRLRRNAADPLPGIERLWLTIQLRYLDIQPYAVRTLEQIVGPVFLFDAKYVSSPVLAELLGGKTGAAPAGWTATKYERY